MINSMKSTNWIPIEFKNSYSDFSNHGIELHFLDTEINEVLRQSCIKFCKWLRKKFWFPVKCKIFFEYYSCYKDEENRNSNAVALFYPGIDDKNGFLKNYPNIWIAVSKFNKEVIRYGKDNAIENYYSLIVHELTHYFQWYFIETERRTKKSLEIEANKCAESIVYEYLNSK